MLAFVAGAANAGGYLAVKQYTSHMTGVVSAMADDLVLGEVHLALEGLGALLCFAFGAACSAVMINFSRRRQLNSEYAMPLMLEAALLMGFGLLGPQLSRMEGLFVPVTVMLLCFMMGLQNAVVTKLSQAEIRTTHVTGMVTDVGIEIGKLLYWNRSIRPNHPTVRANLGRLRLLGALVALFFSGGLIGALGFKHLGYITTLPIALLLVAIAGIPVFDDWANRRRRT